MLTANYIFKLKTMAPAIDTWKVSGSRCWDTENPRFRSRENKFSYPRRALLCGDKSERRFAKAKKKGRKTRVQPRVIYEPKSGCRKAEKHFAWRKIEFIFLKSTQTVFFFSIKKIAKKMELKKCSVKIVSIFWKDKIEKFKARCASYRIHKRNSVRWDKKRHKSVH